MSSKPQGDAPAAGMTITAVHEAIGVSRRTIQRRMKQKVWPGGKCGRNWRVSAPFIEAFIESLTTRPTIDIDSFAQEWMASQTAVRAAA